MGSAWFEIELFCLVESSARPWCTKVCLENIQKFGKDADDGNKRGGLHANQPRKFAIDVSEFAIDFSKFAIDFSKPAIHIRAQIGNRAIKAIE